MFQSMMNDLYSFLQSDLDSKSDYTQDFKRAELSLKEENKMIGITLQFESKSTGYFENLFVVGFEDENKIRIIMQPAWIPPEPPERRRNILRVLNYLNQENYFFKFVYTEDWYVQILCEHMALSDKEKTAGACSLVRLLISSYPTIFEQLRSL